MLRVYQFRNQQRRRAVGGCDSKFDQEPCANKNATSQPERLENDAKDHDGIANDDRGAATKEICGVGDDGESGKGADGHGAV